MQQVLGESEPDHKMRLVAADGSDAGLLYVVGEHAYLGAEADVTVRA